MRTIVFAIMVVVICATAAFAGIFKDNGNETVTDLTTNLMWQQCSAGLSGAGCVTGTTGTYTWSNAIVYCEGLSLGGYADWRLPNVKELRSLADLTKATVPSIETTYFPATVTSWYASSTTLANDISWAWLVSFAYGEVDVSGKTGAYFVRCVRGQ